MNYGQFKAKWENGKGLDPINISEDFYKKLSDKDQLEESLNNYIRLLNEKRAEPVTAENFVKTWYGAYSNDGLIANGFISASEAEQTSTKDTETPSFLETVTYSGIDYGVNAEDPYQKAFDEIWAIWPNAHNRWKSDSFSAFKDLIYEDEIDKVLPAVKLFMQALSTPGNTVKRVPPLKYWLEGQWYDYVVPSCTDEESKDFDTTYAAYPDFRNKEEDRIFGFRNWLKFIKPCERFDFYLACRSYALKNMKYVPQDGPSDDPNDKEPSFNPQYVMSFMSFIGDWKEYLNPFMICPVSENRVKLVKLLSVFFDTMQKKRPDLWPPNDLWYYISRKGKPSLGISARIGKMAVTSYAPLDGPLLTTNAEGRVVSVEVINAYNLSFDDVIDTLNGCAKAYGLVSCKFDNIDELKSVYDKDWRAFIVPFRKDEHVYYGS